MVYAMRVQGYFGLHTEDIEIVLFTYRGCKDIVVYTERLQGYCGVHTEVAGIL